MANVAVIGAQWGDEGKGKIVDWLSSHADVVVRFQGGHNAGHTLVIDGGEYKTHNQLPNDPNTYTFNGQFNPLVMVPDQPVYKTKEKKKNPKSLERFMNEDEDDK